MTDTLLQLDQVTRTYTLPRERLWGPPPMVHAVRGISLRMHSGKNLGVVGESGSGKSTLARLVMALEEPTSGTVQLLSQALGELGPAALRAARRDFQMVFQDPYGSLDPRQTVETIITEPLAAIGGTPTAEMHARARAVLDSVGLRGSDLGKYPHEFSGGQRQRVAIARALLTDAPLLLLDDALSAVDTQTETQILNHLRDARRGRSVIIVSHRLSSVLDANHILVLQHARVTEAGTHADLVEQDHWYASQWRYQQLEASLAAD